MKERVAQLFDIYANKLVQFSQQRGRQYWLIFLFILAITLVTIAPSLGLSQLKLGKGLNSQIIETCANETGKELRGVWLTNVDSDVLFSSEKTKNAIASLANLNFNTVYPTVWNWGYTLYPSSVAEKATGLALDPTEELQNRDVLQEVIATAHQRQMTVIPWVEFGFMAPADSELAQRHPHWLTKRLDGSTIWWEGKMHQRVWLNPLHPEVQQFVTDLMVEIVSNYEIDGIQVDDHFGYPSEFGYDEFTVKLYQNEHNGQLPPQDSRDPAWIRWRADKITAYFETLFKAIKQQKPQVIMSVSPNPQKFSLNSFLLDWHQWERKGLIEELIVQVYRDRQDSFISELNQPELLAAKENIPVGVGILSGLRSRPIFWNFIRQQVKEIRQRNFAGVSFFYYESLWNSGPESPERRQIALKSLFNYPAERPSLLDCQFSQK